MQGSGEIHFRSQFHFQHHMLKIQGKKQCIHYPAKIKRLYTKLEDSTKEVALEKKKCWLNYIIIHCVNMNEKKKTFINYLQFTIYKMGVSHT